MRVVQIDRAAVVLLFVGLLAVVAFVPQLAAQAPAPEPETVEREAPRRVAIRFLTDSDFPPFNYFDEDNVLTGFNVDVARAICLELDAACDIQVRPWAALLPALAKGEAEAVIASHSVNAQRRSRSSTSPTATISRRPASPASAGPPSSTSRPRAWRERGSPSPKGPRTRPTCAPSSATARSACSKPSSWPATRSIVGAVDLLFDDGISLAFWLNGTASRACCEFKGGPFAEPKYFGDGIGIAVKRDDVAAQEP